MNVRWRTLPMRAKIAGGILLLVALLAVTSLGVFGLPGWWNKSPGEQFDLSGPTLSLFPPAFGAHPMGTDNIGQDYFALTMRGAQISLLIAVVVGLVSTVLGVVIGAAAGYFGGWIDAVLMRITDVVMILPMLVIAAVIGRTVGDKGPLMLAVMIGMISWPALARLVRSEVLSLRQRPFIRAAEVIGVPARKIIRRHVLPNVAPLIVVNATLGVASAILLESALSFLGFGVRPPDTSLGLLINEYRTAMVSRPWLFWWPGLTIIVVVLAANFLGDGIRAALDPRRRKDRLRTRRNPAGRRTMPPPPAGEPGTITEPCTAESRGTRDRNTASSAIEGAAND